jgi:carbon-monoxide dehydrogenase large subunit
MVQFSTSQPVRRVEDSRFTTGKGTYTDDINVDGQAYGYMLRSPVAHATIASIDCSEARSITGVIGIVTANDLEAEGVNSIPCLVPMENRDGSQAPMPNRPVLCSDRVRHVGDNLAFIIAESLSVAKDAAELIEINYTSLDAIADTASALESPAPVIHPEAPSNLAFDWGHGEEADTNQAFGEAVHTVSLKLINNKLIVNSMEPRGAIAEFDATTGKATLHTCTQGGWLLKDQIANHTLKTAPGNVRVVTPDVGGGFGMKTFYYPEQALCVWSSRKFGRPVKWIGERGDSFISDIMGRDHITTVDLAFNSNYEILGMRVDTIANMGAYLSNFGPFIPTLAAIKVMPGVYDIKTLSVRVRGVFTNTVPVDAYRGAGRPESIYMIERLMDKAAQQLGVDRVELRRKNFIAPTAMPFTTTAGEIYDSGEFEHIINTVTEKAEWTGIDERRSVSRKNGKRRGIGLCYYIESTMGEPGEAAEVKFSEDGTVNVLVGTQSNGQGHETAYAQISSDRLGVPIEQIRIVQGDTDAIPTGGGTGGSRSLTAQATAIDEAADLVIERGKQYAAQALEAAPADIEFSEGTFQIAGTDRRIGILPLAAQARTMELPNTEIAGGLDARGTITLPAWTFPNGCHVAEVEIDPSTGRTELLRYTIVDDFGTLVNPMLVEGQVHGGVAQGVGQALLENTVYSEDGQLLSGSFMDYCMPRADDFPPFEFSNVVIPCKNNPRGIKGCGEAGSVASPAAVVNAVVHALSEDGIEHLDMPITPEVVWSSLQK